MTAMQTQNESMSEILFDPLISEPARGSSWFQGDLEKTRFYIVSKGVLNLIYLLKRYETRELWNSSQDGGVGRHASPPPATTKRITTKSQNKEHPELSEN